MARVTVEDCVLRVPNRFELVMMAAQRARSISAGARLTVERDNDKNPVVALREIAEQTVELDELESALVKGLQKHVEMDEPEEDEMDLLAIQQELSAEADSEAEMEEDGLVAEDEGEDTDMTAESTEMPMYEDVEEADADTAEE